MPHPATAAPAAEASANPGVTIPRTSLDTYQPTDVTVRFRRWSAWGNSAYMRGQEAGFSRHEAELMRRQGIQFDVVQLEPLEREIAPSGIVRK